MFSRKTLLLNITLCFCELKERNFKFFLNFLLTAQPQACAGLVLLVVFFFFFKPRSRRLGGFLLCLRSFRNFFLVLSVSRPKLPLGHCCHQMMSSSANYSPFLSSFGHIPPSVAFCQVSKLTIHTEHGRQ